MGKGELIINIRNMKKGIFIAVILLIIIIAGVLALTRGSENKTANQNTNSFVNSANTNTRLNANTDSQSEDAVRIFNITGESYAFSVKEIRVKKGDLVRINFSSNGGMHDWNIDEFNASTILVDDGDSDFVEFTASKTGTFEYYCSVENHRSMGMVGKLIVE